MSFEVSKDRAGDIVIARLRGDLDRGADAALVELEAGLAESAGLVLDFAPTDYISSSGLALLVRLARSAAAAGAKVSAMGLDDHYRHVFEITRLDSVIPVRGDEQAALAAVEGGDER